MQRVRFALSSFGQRLGLVPDPPGDNIYHGFISYSHSADAELARALQRGLQRFAKPWYRARALHVFRDEAALSANPDLWDSVRAALDASRYYILLASPQAARSEWVAREADYWREQKGLDRILIALTGGDLPFGGDPVPEEKNALPKPLRDAFANEPRYIDLRWAKEAEELSLSHPQFREAVAELASPLHGRPKEEISSEEVRQQRRTRRVARTAAMSLLTLLASAVAAALVAYSQYQSAHARSLAAQATADLGSDPQQSIALALQSTEIKSNGTAVLALRQALAQAPLRMVIDSKAGDSTHAAWNPTAEQIAISGPNDTVQEWNPRTGRLQRVLHGPDRTTPRFFSANGPLLYSPDGRWIAYADGRGTVSVWNALSGSAAPAGELEKAIAGSGARATSGTNIAWVHDDQLLVSGTGLDRVFSFDPGTGSTQALVNLPGDEELLAPSPDGSKILLGFSGGRAAGGTVNLDSGTFVPLSGALPSLGLSDEQACWLPGGTSFVTWNPIEAQDLFVRFWDARTGRETSSLPAAQGTISAAACGGTERQPWLATGDNGGQAVLRILGGLDYGLSGHSQIIHSVSASIGGAYVATGSDDGTARIWNTSNGSLVQVLSDGSPVNSIQFSPDSGLAMTTDQRGLVKIWDAGTGEPSTVFASPGSGHAYPLGFLRGGTAVYGLNATVAGHALRGASLVTWNSASGAVKARIPLPTDITAAQVPCGVALKTSEFCRLTPPPNLLTRLPAGGSSAELDVAVAATTDGRWVAYAQPGVVSILDSGGHRMARVPVSSPVTGLEFAPRADVLLVMSNRALWLWRAGARPIKIPQASPPIDAELSADGTTVASAQTGGAVGVWNASSGRSIALLRPSAAVRPPFIPASARSPLPLRVAVSPDGSTVAAGTIWQTVSIWRARGHRLIAARLVSTPRNYAGSFGGEGPWPIAELAFSDDGSRLLAVDFPQIGAGDSEPPGTATVFDPNSGRIVDGFLSPGTLGAAVSPGVALSPDGAFLLGGVLGFAPRPPGGAQSVYQVGGQGMLALNLQNAGLAPLATAGDDPVPADPWSPDGVHVLAGARGIYTCAACGSLAQLQESAHRRAIWAHPLSVGHDTVPGGPPYG